MRLNTSVLDNGKIVVWAYSTTGHLALWSNQILEASQLLAALCDSYRLVLIITCWCLQVGVEQRTMLPQRDITAKVRGL